MPTDTPNTREKNEEDVDMMVEEDTDVRDRLMLKALGKKVFNKALHTVVSNEPNGTENSANKGRFLPSGKLFFHRRLFHFRFFWYQYSVSLTLVASPLGK